MTFTSLERPYLSSRFFRSIIFGFSKFILNLKFLHISAKNTKVHDFTTKHTWNILKFRWPLDITGPKRWPPLKKPQRGWLSPVRGANRWPGSWQHAIYCNLCLFHAVYTHNIYKYVYHISICFLTCPASISIYLPYLSFLYLYLCLSVYLYLTIYPQNRASSWEKSWQVFNFACNNPWVIISETRGNRGKAQSGPCWDYWHAAPNQNVVGLERCLEHGKNDGWTELTTQLANSKSWGLINASHIPLKEGDPEPTMDHHNIF